MIINQTIYDLFPPEEVDSAAVRPLTPTEFIQRVLVPEAAVRLVMEDLGQSRARAIRTLRESASYGVAMFPDEQEHTPGKGKPKGKGRGKGTRQGKEREVDAEMEMDAGERIVRERAAARRKQLEQEEMEEEALRATVSDPASESELEAALAEMDTRSSTNSRVESHPGTPRPRRRCLERTRTPEGSSSESDVDMDAGGDEDYMSSKTRRTARGKVQDKEGTGGESSRTRARAPSKASDTEVGTMHSQSRPRPRPRPRPLEAMSESGGAESESADHPTEIPMSSATSTSSIRSAVSTANGLHTMTVQRDVRSTDNDVEMTPRAKPSRSSTQNPSFVPLLAARARSGKWE